MPCTSHQQDLVTLASIPDVNSYALEVQFKWVCVTAMAASSSPNCVVPAGKKAGRVLKRTASSLITTCWTNDHSSSSSLTIPPSAQKDSLLDADSILAHDVPSLRDAAAIHQNDKPCAEDPMPAEMPAPPATAPAKDQPTDLSQPAPAQPVAPAAELPLPMTPAQPVAPAAELLVPNPLQAHPANQVAASVQLAPAQPAAPVQPVQLQVPHHAHTANTPVDSDGGQPARMQPSASQTFKGAQLAGNVAPVIVHQAALPYTAPQATVPLHANITPDDTWSNDKVASSGCLGILCCFKTHKLHHKKGKGERGMFGRRRR